MTQLEYRTQRVAYLPYTLVGLAAHLKTIPETSFELMKFEQRITFCISVS